MPRGIPKRDGSGMGMRLNMGRGGCNPPMNRGLGRGMGRGFRRRRIFY